MPFVAEFDGARIDLTLTGEQANAMWEAIWRTRVGSRLVCPECRGEVRAKRVDATGTRFVAHVSMTAACSLAAESAAHRLWKLELVQLARSMGWDAHPEWPGPGWRADVFATSPTASPPRSVIFEVQMSTEPNDLTRSRHQARESAGCEVVWIVRRPMTWMRQVPSWRLSTQLVSGLPSEVTDGLWSDTDGWHRREPVPLRAAVSQFFAGELVWKSSLLAAIGTHERRTTFGRPWGGDGGWAEPDEILRADDRRVADEHARAARLAEQRRRNAENAERAQRRKVERDRRRQPSAPAVRVAPIHIGGPGRRWERQAAAIIEIVEWCRTNDVQHEVRQPSRATHQAAMLVIESRVVLIEPANVTDSHWRGVVVIGPPPVVYETGGCHARTLRDWLSNPFLGEATTSVIDDYERRRSPNSAWR